MFREEEHPRDEIGRFVEKTSDGIGGEHVATESEQKRLEELGISEKDSISLPDERLPRSLSARWANEDIKMPDGTVAHFVEGSKLHHKEVFAGKGTRIPIHDVERLVKTYGGSASEWQKIKATGNLEQYGKTFEAEVHWYEEKSVGKKEIKYKKE